MRRLQPGRPSALLGPCEDGGFYLLALNYCPPELLSNLPWSAEQTCAATRQRLEQAGFKVEFTEPWFDVDHGSDLVRLRRKIVEGQLRAPAVQALFERGLLDTSG